MCKRDVYEGYECLFVVWEHIGSNIGGLANVNRAYREDNVCL